jgi:hypothetical protein
MQAVKYIAVIICAIVALAIVAPFFAQRTPEAYVTADNLAAAQQPVSTAAALRNKAEEIRVNVVVPAQATAEAASILANNKQRISEDAHQQELRHEGEMAALSISNTQRLNEIEASYTARVEGIKVGSAKTVAEANADSARASAGAWRDTIAYGGFAIGAVVLLLGGTLAIVTWLSTRAKIIDHPLTGPILVTGRGIIPLGNITTPMLLGNGTEVGRDVLPLVAQRQAYALIGRAKTADVPELARAAQHATTQTVQAGWQISNPTALDDAVQALPAGQHDELLGRVPTMADLLKRWRPTRAEMLLGIDRGGVPWYCALEDLLSTGVIGRPKTGKTTLLRFIYLQCRMLGAQVLVWDLHLTLAGDLPGSNAYTELDTIDLSAEQMCVTLDRRIKSRDYNAQPIMIMADEFNLLAPNSTAVTEAMGRVILEGRKVNMFSMISGQGLPATLFGGSTARDALSSRFVLHTTTRQAQMVGLDRDYIPLVMDLKPGMAIVDGPIDPTVLAIPNTTEADLMAFFPTSGATSKATSEPLPDWTVATSEEVARSGESGSEESDSATSERVNQVIDLMKGGKGRSEAIKIVYQTEGGNKFVKASQEVDQFIMEALK